MLRKFRIPKSKYLKGLLLTYFEMAEALLLEEITLRNKKGNSNKKRLQEILGEIRQLSQKVYSEKV